jgi:translation initiation factor 3 subunit F
MSVGINRDYFQSMYNFHRRINKKEKIVGWYTTTTAEGALINDNSSLIQEFYSSECENPVHLVVDTTLAGEDMGVRGFMSQSMILGESNLANKFLEIKVDLEVTDSEATCLYHMINAQCAKPFAESEVLAVVPDQRDAVQVAMEKLLVVLEEVQKYVDGVVDGSVSPMAEYGMKIADAISALQSVKPEEFHTALQEKIQDLLMVSYISTLTQTQLAISAKINAIL